METHELTEYEQVRQPQEICIDTEITTPPRSLYREIICPICLDVLSNTRAAPDCLHRFCTKCIDKALKKNCPICRKRLPSNPRNFKKDLKFDQLISIIFNRDNLQNDLIQEPSKAPECEIILKPLDGQQTRYIKCPPTATVDHLAKYLSMRPDTSKNPKTNNKNGTSDNNQHQQYKLCIVANRCQGHYEPLQGSLKIEEIRKTYNLLSDRPLEIYYIISCLIANNDAP